MPNGTSGGVGGSERSLPDRAARGNGTLTIKQMNCLSRLKSRSYESSKPRLEQKKVKTMAFVAPSEADLPLKRCFR